MDLTALRKEIDSVDAELIRLFCTRMELAAQIGNFKKEHGLPVLAPGREAEKLLDVKRMAGPEMAEYTRVLYTTLFELSRSYQNKQIGVPDSLYHRILRSIPETPCSFPPGTSVACFGQEPSGFRSVCESMFQSPEIRCLNSFAEVFSALAQDLCQYGFLSLESTDAFSGICELLYRHNFTIVCSVRQRGAHTAPMQKGTSLKQPIRYLCISKKPEIRPDACRTAIVMRLNHDSGSLYKVFSRFFTLGISIAGVESFPSVDAESAPRVCFELDIPICSGTVSQLFCCLDEICEEYWYLGSYPEVLL